MDKVDVVEKAKKDDVMAQLYLEQTNRVPLEQAKFINDPLIDELNLKEVETEQQLSQMEEYLRAIDQQVSHFKEKNQNDIKIIMKDCQDIKDQQIKPLKEEVDKLKCQKSEIRMKSQGLIKTGGISPTSGQSQQASVKQSQKSSVQVSKQGSK